MTECIFDHKKIGIMTGKVKLADGNQLCAPHWKALGFNTTTDATKAATISSEMAISHLTSGTSLKDALKEQSSDKLNRIKVMLDDAGVSDLFGTKKEVKALPEIISDDETILYATSGLVDGNTILAVLTNSRIIFVDKGMVYGIKSSEIPLNMINGVSYSKGMVLGSISVVNGAITTKIDNVSKATAPIFVEKIKDATAALKQNSQQTIVTNTSSTADEILKFKNLLDQGIITDEEFTAKKKELLGL